jgi:hypothetical protein
MTIALAIPHTAWIPERVESLERLREQLGIHADELGFELDERDMRYREFTERAPNKVWSGQLWTWGLETGAGYVLQLQDDAEVAPDFWVQLHKILAAVPDQIIGLEAAHPRGKQLAHGGCTWYTTTDMLIGVGYVLPRAILAEFLEWRASSLHDGWVIDEDMLIAVFAMCAGRRIWHPVPTIIDHDVTIASTYGHDAHVCRRPSVTWKDKPCPVDWTPRGVPHMGRFYSHTPEIARRWVRGVTSPQLQRMRNDVWRGEVRA